MSWRSTRRDVRGRLPEKFDTAEVADYHAVVATLDPDDEAAHLQDIADAFSFEPGMRVLDVGTGTGAVCQLLSRIDGLAITAMDPAPAMLDLLRSRPEFAHIPTVAGFCDADEDRHHFEEAAFDVIISRQVANGLYDPLAAFKNWRHWLKPQGAAVVLDGLYDRASWRGRWEEEVDDLPLSACQSTAMVPYLLETAGFDVEHVGPMQRTNARPATRTLRFMVVARKPG